MENRLLIRVSLEKKLKTVSKVDEVKIPGGLASSTEKVEEKSSSCLEESGEVTKGVGKLGTQMTSCRSGLDGPVVMDKTKLVSGF